MRAYRECPSPQPSDRRCEQAAQTSIAAFATEPMAARIAKQKKRLICRA